MTRSRDGAHGQRILVQISLGLGALTTERIRELGCGALRAATIVEGGWIEGGDGPTYAFLLDLGTSEDRLSALWGERMQRDPGLAR